MSISNEAVHKQYNEMYGLLSSIAVFSKDKEYAKLAEELIKQIRNGEIK